MLRWPSRWKCGGLLFVLTYFVSLCAPAVCTYLYYLFCEWRFTLRIDESNAHCPQFDSALLDSSFSSLLLSLLILQITSVAFLFITSNERDLIIAKMKALDMPYDATKTDAELEELEAELPWSANVELLLFGGFFGRILDLRGEKPGVPWAYVIAMPALRFLGETGILHVASTTISTRNDTLRIEYELPRTSPLELPDGTTWRNYKGPDVVVARCAKDEPTPARFTNTEDDIVHPNGWRLLRRQASGTRNSDWEVLSPYSDFVKSLNTKQLRKVIKYGVLPPKTLVKVPVTDIVPALRTAIAASNSFARSQKLMPRDEWRTLEPCTFGDAQMLCRGDPKRFIHQCGILLNQELLEADVDMLSAAS
jgi:hypothetical protein